MRYKCEVCLHDLDPKSPSVLHWVEGWAKGATHAVKHHEKNYHRYVHEFCLPSPDKDQLPLF